MDDSAMTAPTLADEIAAIQRAIVALEAEEERTHPAARDSFDREFAALRSILARLGAMHSGRRYWCSLVGGIGSAVLAMRY